MKVAFLWAGHKILLTLFAQKYIFGQIQFERLKCDIECGGGRGGIELGRLYTPLYEKGIKKT